MPEGNVQLDRGQNLLQFHISQVRSTREAEWNVGGATVT